MLQSRESTASLKIVFIKIAPPIISVNTTQPLIKASTSAAEVLPGMMEIMTMVRLNYIIQYLNFKAIRKFKKKTLQSLNNFIVHGDMYEQVVDLLPAYIIVKRILNNF